MTTRPTLTIARRLSLGFAAVMGMVVILAVVSIGKVNRVASDLALVSDVNSVKQRYAINFRGSVHDRSISLRDVTLVGDAAARAAVLADIERLTDKYAKSAGPLDAMMASGASVTPEETGILAGIKETETRTLPLIARVVERQRAGDAAGAHAVLMNEARPAFVEWLARINQFIDLEEAKNKEVAASARSVSDGFQTFMLLLCGGALAIGGAVAWWALRSVRPLRDVTDAMRALAAGDLGQAVPHQTVGAEVGAIARAAEDFRRATVDRMAQQLSIEAQQKQAQAQERVNAALAAGLGALAEGDLTATIDEAFPPSYEALRIDYNAAVDKLRALFAAIQESAGSIGASTGEVARATEDLARRTEQQAATLEQSSAAIEQTSSTVKATAENARTAARRVGVAKAAAQDGGKVAGEAQAAMALIQQSSAKIGAIVGVIEQIAYQTNILALNANVEAARAGEAGRGFAVVANEVRSLAQRSSGAAKEIKELIAQSGEHVGAGVSLVGQSGASLARIADEVVALSDLFARIADATEQQASGLAEVSSAIAQMESATQQNAAMVEQSTAAARSLTTEANELAGRVETFQTGEAAAVPAVRPAPRMQRASAVPMPSIVRSVPTRSGSGSGSASAAAKQSPLKSVAQAAPKSKRKLAAVAGGGRAAAMAIADDDWTQF